MYLKSHSFGEFVFDQSWAEAFQRVGGRYYPKLQIAVPFTPVTGARLLVRPGPEEVSAATELNSAVVDVARRLNVSSLHLTFSTKREWERLGKAGFLARTDVQFVWFNRDYESFDDFLGSLASRKRKMIVRERRAVGKAGIAVDTLDGADLRTDHWDEFFHLYQATSRRKWGYPYLSREFFARIGDAMADEIVFVAARRDGELIAAALHFVGAEALFGRNWGCLEYLPFLHFELCYYRAIEYAIAHRLERVEAGAQGPHKLARGYLPVPTYSAHWIAHQGLRDAIARFLVHENKAVAAEIAALNARAPFKE